MKSFSELRKLIENKPKKTIAVASSSDLEVLEAVIFVSSNNYANFLLFGDLQKTNELLMKNNLKLNDNIQLINTISVEEAVKLAVGAVATNKAQILMKGLVDTKVILKEVLNKEYGLRTNSILSHITVLELPKLKRLLYLTDAAMNIDPTSTELKTIILNTLNLTKELITTKPKVALLSAVEKVNPKMPSTLKALEVLELFKDDKSLIIEGPLAVDLAISKEAAKIKNITGEIQGDADILVVPMIEMGNALYKGWVFGCDGVKNAGIVVGAKCPIILTSRADNHEAKVNSILLSLAM